MKYNFLITTAMLLIGFSSCSKVLDVEPIQSVDFNNAIENDQDVNSLVVGIYSIMGTANLYGTDLLMTPDLLASDDYCFWYGTFQDQRQIANKTIADNNIVITGIWTSAYEAINNANIVLANLDKVADEDLRQQLEGEALFARGTMLFELVRLYALPWGATTDNAQLGVPISTTAVLTEEGAAAKGSRATVAEVYQQIIADLTTATEKLPEINSLRATKYTALGLLSRVYLQQGNYLNARNAANEIIEGGLHSLNASVIAVFTNKNTEESLWEIQQNEQNNAGQANDGMSTFYADLPGIGRGGDLAVNPDFLDKNLNTADLRRTELYYTGISRTSDIFCKKWASPFQNLPIIRIAEIYLTRAECNKRLNEAVGATPAQDLSMVQNSIRTNSESSPNPTLDAILQQRSIELAFEGVRIHDIRRLRQNTGEFAWNANELVLPIPLREVNASNGSIIQNPGY